MEADAKRLQTKEEELMKKKQEIRNHLTQLKKERRDLRTAVEAAAGKRTLKKRWTKGVAEDSLQVLIPPLFTHQANARKRHCRSG